MKTPYSRYRATAAFTLIELLTVIAIIGILAAIIIPVVGKVRQSARWSQGSANIRQATLGMIMLAEENRGQLLRWNEPRPDGTNGNWGSLLTQYLNSADRNATPAAMHSALLDPLVSVEGSLSGVYHFSSPDMQCPDRSRDTQFAAGGAFASFGRYRNIRGYTSPSMQIYLADSGVNADGRGAWGNLTTGDLLIWNVVGWTSAVANNPIAPGDNTPGNIRWTDGRAKFGFLDGHVKILRAEEVKKRNINPALQ